MTMIKPRNLAVGLMMIALLAALFVASTAAKAEDIDVDVWDGKTIAQSVKSDHYEDKYVSLTADIDLNNEPWTP